jgi:alpha-tubulin suppressor-like RCC1 family protein
MNNLQKKRMVAIVFVLAISLFASGCGNGKISQGVSGLLAPSKVVAIAAGDNAGYAVKSDGTVWAWGQTVGITDTSSSASDNSTGTGTIVPAKALGIAGVVSVATGNSTVYALKADGTVWAWGTYAPQGITPAQIAGLADIAGITVIPGSGEALYGGGTLSDTCYALKKDGTVWAWGSNTDGLGQMGLLGCNTSVASSKTPVQVSGLANVKIVAVSIQPYAAAADCSVPIAIESNGTAWMWGNGNLTPIRDNDPIDAELKAIVYAEPSFDDSYYVLKNDGTIWRNYKARPSVNIDSGGAWGFNGPPAQVKAPEKVPGLANIIAISGFSANPANYVTVPNYSNYLVEGYALKSDGTVWCFGSKADYLDDTIAYASGQVPGLSNVMAIATGKEQVYALKTDGTVWAWGKNECGQLGDNSISNSDVPVQVSGLK